MKKQIFSIVAIIIGLFVSRATFAQDIEYTDCTKNTSNWTFVCQEYQSCNNPDWFCVCVKNSLLIPHNTTCLANDTLIKNRVVSSYAVSGSTVIFKFTIQNNSTAKFFELRLPPAYEDTRISVKDLTSDGLLNWASVILHNWLVNPFYLINWWQTKTIIVTGEVVSKSLLFWNISTSACLRSLTSSSCINQPVSFILPIANYSITQTLLNPLPLFSTEKAIYEIKVSNNGSKANNDGVKLNSILGNFLGTPDFTEQKAAFISPQPINKTYTRDLGTFTPGQVRTYTITAPLTSTPPAGSLIITTGNISAWRELQLSDNIVTTTYTVPTVVDIFLEDLKKTSPEPETNRDVIWFSVSYVNNGNTTAKDISLVAFISGTNQDTTIFNLPDLAPQTMNMIEITWSVNQNYPVWTKFCFSWTINASNETATGNNNSLSGLCYTLMKSADIAVEANLVNELVSINSWSTLSYDIKLSNKGEKTANNVSLALYPSANQVSQTSILLTGITLIWWEEKTISYTSILNDYPAQGTTITLSGEINFTWIDLDSSNNNFSLSYALPGLSDLYISHIMLPFSGFKAWDTVTYVITYWNSWFAAAWNPMINFSLPEVITASQNQWSLGKSMAAWDSGTIIVTWTLKKFLDAWTEFSSQATISTTSAQITTGNDSSLITGTVPSYNNIVFNISAENTTRPMLNISWNLWAVSGDIIKFTISYVNNWNVPANNTTLTFWDLRALTLDSYNSNLGTIWAGQQGSVVVNWHIAYKNFVSISPSITISYNNTWTSRIFTIVEPYVCGDTFLTRDEECELDWQWVTNPDQSCEEIQGVCRLVTKRISNTACVQPRNGIEICSTPAVINLEDPSCENLDIVRESSTRITANCFGNYTRAYTPVSISCGNGDGWTGFAGTLEMFSTTCRYDSASEANRSKISCIVWNDNTNEDCTRSVLSCDLDLDSKVVILDADEEEWTVDVECSLDNDDSEASLQIVCGNGDESDIEQDDHIRYTCTYEEDDFSSNRDRIMDIECRVNNNVACEDEVILDQGIIGICGDGIRQGYEQCDLPNGTEIRNDLDEQDENDASASVRNKGKICYNCAIKDEAPAQCLSVHNGNISVEKDEYLPFWWKVNGGSFTRTTNCSDPLDKGKIIKSSMQCEFEIQKPGKAGDKEVKTILDRECISNPWSQYKIFNYFSQYITANTWRYAVDLGNFNTWIDNDLGEYKLRLKRIEYDYCSDDNEKESSVTDNVCETNFTITKPYLVQKSAFGITPKVANIDLEDFYDIDGKNIITRTDLSDIMLLDANDYAGDNDVINLMIDGFVSSAERLAVDTKRPPGLEWQWVTAKKVPNKDIYILLGGTSVTLKKNANVTKPFTLIVKDADLIIEGNIDVNGMFLVQNGTIKFINSECNNQQVVKGIFVAKAFDGTKKKNNSLTQEWCNAWGLNVKGVLIGAGIQKLVENKRSNLSSWFKVSWTDKTMATQRRNMILNGASVLIEYSPELWQKLPPGADEFTKALEVYKK